MESECLGMGTYLGVGFKALEVPFDLGQLQGLISNQKDKALQILLAEPSILGRVSQFEDLSQIVSKFFRQLMIFGDEELVEVHERTNRVRGPSSIVRIESSIRS
jgi:hypothetical protein